MAQGNGVAQRFHLQAFRILRIDWQVRKDDMAEKSLKKRQLPDIQSRLWEQNSEKWAKEQEDICVWNKESENACLLFSLLPHVHSKNG